MARITIPTIDQIKGSTVMLKLRNLISHFITFAGEVNDNLEEFNTTLNNGAIDYVQAEQTNDTVTVKLTMKDGSIKAFNFTSTSGVTLDTVQTILADKTFSKKVFVNGQFKANNTAEIVGNAYFRNTAEVSSGELIVGDINVKQAIQTLDGETETLMNDVAELQDNVVTLDGSQTITGTKNIKNKINYGYQSVNATDPIFGNTDVGLISVLDKSQLYEMSALRTRRSVDATHLYVTAYSRIASSPQYAELDICKYDDGRTEIHSPTVASGASSNTVVNKAYVSATDASTNNLVHRTANESILGNKTFTDKIYRRIAFADMSEVPTSTYYPNWIDIVDKNGASMGYIGGIETVGQSYVLINKKALDANGKIHSFNLQLRMDRATGKEVLQMQWGDGTYQTIAERTVTL